MLYNHSSPILVYDLLYKSVISFLTRYCVCVDMVCRCDVVRQSLLGLSFLQGSLLETLQEVQPNLFGVLPRLLEKFEEKMSKPLNSLTGLKKILINWARNKARKNAINLASGYVE